MSSAGVSGSGSGAPGTKIFPPKFAGNITTNGAVRSDFKTYWNQITPENEGKWGSVQPAQGTWNWGSLDAVYKYANDNDLVFEEHNFVWGAQQPTWVNDGNAQTAVRAWMQAFCQRYPNTQIIEIYMDQPIYKKSESNNGLLTLRAYALRSFTLIVKGVDQSDNSVFSEELSGNSGDLTGTYTQTIDLLALPDPKSSAGAIYQVQLKDTNGVAVGGATFTLYK